MAFLELELKDNSTPLSPNEWNYLVNKLNARRLNDLIDVEASDPKVGDTIVHNGSGWVFTSLANGGDIGGGGASTFIELTDTPNNNIGKGNWLVGVDSSEAGLTYFEPKTFIDDLGIDASTLGGNGASISSAANKIVVRDSSGDIHARLLRTTYTDQTSISGAIAFRTNNSSDNYTRYCSSPSAVRTWLGAAATSHSHSYLPLSGGTLTGDITCNSSVGFKYGSTHWIRTRDNSGNTHIYAETGGIYLDAPIIHFRSESGDNAVTVSNGTITGTLNGTADRVDGGVVTGTGTKDLLYVKMADNDYFRIRVGATASNAGYAEIATADDGNEPIYVRQYTGVFTTLRRTLTLLDASGNTKIPNKLSVGTNSTNGTLAVSAYNGTITVNDELGNLKFQAGESNGSGGFLNLNNEAGSNTVKIRSYGDANGVQAYFTAGNVGIGTNSPNNPLDVVGKINGSADISAGGNIRANGSYYYGDNKVMFQFSDAWLRINASSAFTNGTYFGSTTVRTDGVFQSLGSGSEKIAMSRGSGSAIVGMSTNKNALWLSVGGGAAGFWYDGNLGIGTTNPSQALDVVGSLRLTNTSDGISTGQTLNQIEFYGSDSSGIGASVKTYIQTISKDQYGGAYHLKFGTSKFGEAAADRMIILDSGNVGINTTSPSEKLDVNGNAVINGTLAVEGLYSVKGNTALNVVNDDTLGSNTGAYKLISQFKSSGASNGFYNRQWVLRRITGSDWSTVQHVDGISVDTSYGTPTTSRTWWKRNAVGGIHEWGDRGNTNLTLSSGGDGTFRGSIETNGDYRRTAWNNGGLVGRWNEEANHSSCGVIYSIGSSYKPNTTSLANMYGIGFAHEDASFLSSTNLGTTPLSGAWGLYIASQGAARIFLDSNNGRILAKGNIYADGGNFRGDVIAFATSDRRLKDFITPIKNPLEMIMKISGNTFVWNDNQDTYKGEDYGVVAQEIKEVMPSLVNEREDGYLAVKYEKIVPLLIESIKELKRELDKLKNK